MVTTTNPRTGEHATTELKASTPAEVANLAEAAEAATAELRIRGRELRAELLEAMSDAIEADREELVATADAETGLGAVRLNNELSRSSFQFRLFAEAVREGGFLEAAIDHAGDTPLGPAPDVRRMLVSVGPVAVFGSSNFPFAFSVLGGDVAAAIAAGSAVVVKAHSSHPLTSQRSMDALIRAGESVDAPAHTFGIIYGQSAGVSLVMHPSIAAVGFTGSLAAGSALRAAIEQRPDPIPFYGELSSVNALVITPGAVAVRSSTIAAGLFAAFTGSGGQLCTKPGVAFIPAGVAGQPLVDELVALTQEATRHVLLNDRIRDSYEEISGRLVGSGGQEIAVGATESSAAFDVAPRILEVNAAELTSELSEECFGPLMVIARYESIEDIEAGFLHIPRSLTATVHFEDNELDGLSGLLASMEKNVGRIVFNGYPTGVRVSWAQNHGGPWPATNSQHTSVGVTSVRRFLRPAAWQDAPQSVLPVELRDGDLLVPTRIDGGLCLPAQTNQDSDSRTS